MDSRRTEGAAVGDASSVTEEAIFGEALVMESAEERRAYLDRVCGDNESLRRGVEALLGCHAKAAGCHFLAADGRPASRATNAEASVWEEPGTLIGRYRLLEKMGEGGFGVVYLAEQWEPVVRQVALKILKLGMDTKAVVARFEAERQALALMDHPNIAQVFDGGATVTGRPYFVMERVVGMRITDFCDAHGLTAHERIELFIKVCHAVQHAHQKGVIHRDLKPSNILVAHTGGPASQACPKVIDFGIAKATEARLTDATVLTREQMLMGTPAYMSPEQAAWGGQNIDTRSDVYSLGVLLYELLTGETPFDPKHSIQDGVEGLCRTIREVEPPRPSTRVLSRPVEGDERRTTGAFVRVEEVRGDLDWIVMKCLEKDRSRRYATVNGLALDLERHLRDEPVEARPPSRGYRLTKWVRRNRGLLAALSAIVVLLLAGAVTSSLLAVRAVRAEGAERELRRRAEEAREFARMRAYTADMRAAGTALAANDLGGVHDFLQRYVPEVGERDLRGMEWRYLWSATRGAETQSFTLDRWINCARLSPDGSQLACAVFGGGLRILDPHTGRVLTNFVGVGEKYANESLGYSPDGRLLACANAEGVVIRETRGWTTVQSWPGNTEAVGFSQDGATFVRLDDDGAHFHDVRDWRLRGKIPARAPGMGRVAFSPDGRHAVILRRSLPDLEWVDLETMQATGGLGHSQFSLSIAFSPDGKRLATGNSDGDIQILDLETRGRLTFWKAHPRYVFGLAFSPDGAALATAGGDQLVQLWRASGFETNGPAKLATWRGHRNEIWSLSFSSDGHSLLSAGRDSTVKRWDVRESGDDEGLSNWPSGGISLGFTGDSHRYVRLSTDPERLQVWSTFPHRMEAQVPATPLGAVVLAGTRAYFGSNEGFLDVIRLPQCKTERRPRLMTGPLRVVQVSDDGRLFVGWDRQAGKVILWDLESQQRISEFPDFAVPEMSPSWSIPQRAAFSPDGRSLAYASTNFSIKIWDVARRETVRSLDGHVWHIQTLRFSPDGRILVTAGWDGMARVWDPSTGREMVPGLNHQTGIASVAFSADGRTILTLGGDTQLHFWIAATGEESLSVTAGAAWFAHLLAADERAIAWDVGDGAMRTKIRRLPTLSEIDANLVATSQRLAVPDASGRSLQEAPVP